jgi:hypothetical protein
LPTYQQRGLQNVQSGETDERPAAANAPRTQQRIVKEKHPTTLNQRAQALEPSQINAIERHYEYKGLALHLLA